MNNQRHSYIVSSKLSNEDAVQPLSYWLLNIGFPIHQISSEKQNLIALFAIENHMNGEIFHHDAQGNLKPCVEMEFDEMLDQAAQMNFVIQGKTPNIVTEVVECKPINSDELDVVSQFIGMNTISLKHFQGEEIQALI